VDPGGSWLPPAGRCPVVQLWHGARETSSGRNPERTVVREETLEGPGMQQWHKGPRPKKADARQQANKGPRRQTDA
jgi:hypothetical protein